MISALVGVLAFVLSALVLVALARLRRAPEAREIDTAALAFALKRAGYKGRHPADAGPVLVRSHAYVCRDRTCPLLDS